MGYFKNLAIDQMNAERFSEPEGDLTVEEMISWIEEQKTAFLDGTLEDHKLARLRTLEPWILWESKSNAESEVESEAESEVESEAESEVESEAESEASSSDDDEPKLFKFFKITSKKTSACFIGYTPYDFSLKATLNLHIQIHESFSETTTDNIFQFSRLKIKKYGPTLVPKKTVDRVCAELRNDCVSCYNRPNGTFIENSLSKHESRMLRFYSSK